VVQVRPGWVATKHNRPFEDADQPPAVAAGALPDGTQVIITGDWNGTVRVWRLANGTLVVPPLDLAEPVRAVAVHGNVIVTAAGADIAVHQPALSRPMR
jgi:hypothetical protein